MKRYKKNYDLNYRVVRIRAGDWALLKELSQHADIPMAEALHLLLTDTDRAKQELVIPRTQIPMAVFSVRAISALSVNGAKPSALSIKPKGGIIR